MNTRQKENIKIVKFKYKIILFFLFSVILIFITVGKASALKYEIYIHSYSKYFFEYIFLYLGSIMTMIILFLIKPIVLKMLKKKTFNFLYQILYIVLSYIFINIILNIILYNLNNNYVFAKEISIHLFTSIPILFCLIIFENLIKLSKREELIIILNESLNSMNFEYQELLNHYDEDLSNEFDEIICLIILKNFYTDAKNKFLKYISKLKSKNNIENIQDDKEITIEDFILISSNKIIGSCQLDYIYDKCIAKNLSIK